MTSLMLTHLTDIITTSGLSVAMETNPAPPAHIGFIVIGIIVGPVLLLTLASLIEFPKRSKIPELFLGAFVLLVGGMVAGLAAISLLLKFIVPQ